MKKHIVILGVIDPLALSIPLSTPVATILKLDSE